MNRILVTIEQIITVEDDEDEGGDPLPENVDRDADAWRDEIAGILSEQNYRPTEHSAAWEWDDSNRYFVTYSGIIETEDDARTVLDEIDGFVVGVDTVTLVPYV